LWNSTNGQATALPSQYAGGDGGISSNGIITVTTGNMAAILSASGATVFSFPGSVSSQGYGVNDSGAVVGLGRASNPFQSFLRSPSGAFTLIEVPGSTSTEANGINNAGDIVGRFVGERFYGFLLKNGAFSDIVPPDALDSWAQGINNNGEIVGGYGDHVSNVHGYALLDGQYLTLDYPDAVYTEALGVNDSGVIVGLYGGTDLHIHAFEAIPTAVPEPANRWLLPAGAPLLLVVIGKRRRAGTLRRLTSRTS
jgi:uncharacterized membrane protein